MGLDTFIEQIFIKHLLQTKHSSGDISRNLTNITALMELINSNKGRGNLENPAVSI